MDEKQISELLECSVCLERFDQNCKVLPCQHTFCRQCLDEIMMTKHELRCPECRALVTVRVSELPTNFLVVRILEGLKTKHQRSSSAHSGRHHSCLNSSPMKSALSSAHPPQQEPTSVHLSRLGGQPCAKALFNYDSAEREDLSFKKGEIIILRRKIDENWFHGEIDGRCGFFPSNFVQVLVPLPQIPQCVALYDFELKDEGEKDCLSFKKDELLTVIRRVDDNWLEGRKADRIGIFPISFVKLNEAATSLINTKPNSPAVPNSPSASFPSFSSAVSGTSTIPFPASLRGGDVTTPASCTVSSITAPVPPGSSSTLDSSNISGREECPPTALAPETRDNVPPPPPPQHQLMVSTAGHHPSGPVPSSASSLSSAQIPEITPQNKRHSFTSASLSSSHITCLASTCQAPHRHSAEVTFTEGGGLALVSSEMSSTPLSSSLPSSVTMDTHHTAAPSSSSPRNAPSSPIPTAETPADVSTLVGPGTVASLAVHVYIALYNYKPRKDDELELHKGDHYCVVEKCQDGWYKGSCVRSGATGVFPGNYVQLIRPVNSTLMSVRIKGQNLPAPSNSNPHSSTMTDQWSGDTSTQAPPLLPRVAKMGVAGQKSRSPLSHLVGPPLRSLSSPGNTSAAISPKHILSSQLSPAPPISMVSSQPPSLNLSKPMIPAPPLTTSFLPHRSLWVPPSLTSGQHSVPGMTFTNPGIGQNQDSSHTALPTAAKDKKEKKEKEKKGLVKLLSSKSKKSKQALPADFDLAPPVTVVSFDGVAHTRSGSYPVNGSASSGGMGAGGDSLFVSGHKKATSLDSCMTPLVFSQPRSKLTIRERYCCVVPYPPQTDQELCLELGDIIHVHRKGEDGWYKGTQERTGRTGLFPASFVQKCD